MATDPRLLAPVETNRHLLARSGSSGTLDSPRLPDIGDMKITEEPLDQDVRSRVHTRETFFTDFFSYTPTLDTRADVQGAVGLDAPPDDAKRKIIKSILHQITVQSKPIYRCQMPIFCVDPVSMLQKLTDYFIYSHLVHPLSYEADPEKRMLGMVAFYLAIWHLQVPIAARVKNPLNPILGEIYRANFGQGENRVNVLAEQITHHPPSSAFCAWNKHHKWSFEAYIKPDSSFSGTSVCTSLVGDLVAHLYAHNNERYVFSYPKYNVKGLIFGTMRMELMGKPTIVCEATGLVCEIEFKHAGALSGDLNTGVTGRIYNLSDKKKDLYKINGAWDSVVKYTPNGKPEAVLVDIGNLKEEEKFYPSPDEYFANETNGVWGQVKQEIIGKDENNAMTHKVEIEEAQRNVTAERKKQGIVWEPKYFQIVDETWRCPYIREVFNLPQRSPPTKHLEAGMNPEDDSKKKNWFKKAFGAK